MRYAPSSLSKDEGNDKIRPAAQSHPTVALLLWDDSPRAHAIYSVRPRTRTRSSRTALRWLHAKGLPAADARERHPQRPRSARVRRQREAARHSAVGAARLEDRPPGRRRRWRRPGAVGCRGPAAAARVRCGRRGGRLDGERAGRRR